MTIDLRDTLSGVTAPAASQNFSQLPTSAENHDDLTDRQRNAIELLIAGKSDTAVGEAIGVSRRTVYAWRQSEPFQEELERRRHETLDAAADRLRALVHPAIDVLEEEVRDPHDRARMRAVGVILRVANLGKLVAPRKREAD